MSVIEKETYIPSKTDWNVETVRRDFPILQKTIHGNDLVYFDNAATTQKPQIVIDSLNRYYAEMNANVHRGIHTLSERATQAYENTRHKVQNFIGARSPDEIIFTSGTTAAINLVAHSYVDRFLQPGDEILISEMEHHSNCVPWYLACERKQLKLRVAPLREDGSLDIDAYRSLLNEKTKLVALTHVSNALGTLNPIKTCIAWAHECGAVVLIDGAQAVAHQEIDVADLDCDFYAFSSHKLYGPTGVGVLYGKNALLNAMPPYQGGGEMIAQVSFKNGIHFKKSPQRFEAGTPNIAGVIGLGVAVDYFKQQDFSALVAHEQSLLDYATQAIQEIEGIRIIGTSSQKASILSFVIEGIHPHDIGTVVNEKGIAIRAGHHCAMPVMEYFGVPATSRASFAFYNTFAEVDRFIFVLRMLREWFQ